MKITVTIDIGKYVDIDKAIDGKLKSLHEDGYTIKPDARDISCSPM